MNVKRTVLLALLIALLAPAPALADDTGPADTIDDCPVLQITPWAPYVSVQPDCIELPPVRQP